ncbi:lipopolysaccharide assembly LapA domain-containing protein [Paenarthrobacter sp. NPDC018779]|uniref:lipopolysaccharide assembly LapA domain-containing protein n=1 Tax=Paenarthrobacter sp. NPDC018779 TaxID=3364375 RepID=UPI0037C6ED58
MSFQDDAARIPATTGSNPNAGLPPGGAGTPVQPARPRSVDPSSVDPTGAAQPTVPPGSSRPTRTAAVWVAVAVGLVVLVLLIVFFVQNQDMVTVRFFGLEGSLALGTTLFIAAVGGGVLVALAGGARILQLRITNHRRRRAG